MMAGGTHLRALPIPLRPAGSSGGPGNPCFETNLRPFAPELRLSVPNLRPILTPP
jgi:hypothetical protein